MDVFEIAIIPWTTCIIDGERLRRHHYHLRITTVVVLTASTTSRSIQYRKMVKPSTQTLSRVNFERKICYAFFPDIFHNYHISDADGRDPWSTQDGKRNWISSAPKLKKMHRLRMLSAAPHPEINQLDQFSNSRGDNSKYENPIRRQICANGNLFFFFLLLVLVYLCVIRPGRKVRKVKMQSILILVFSFRLQSCACASVAS